MKLDLLTVIRKTLAILVIQTVLITGFTFANFGNQAQAWADTLTPEASSYSVDETSEEVKLGAKETAKSAGNAVGKTTENVKEKLNLDEPIPSDTKKFFRQLQGKEPIVNERMPQLNE